MLIYMRVKVKKAQLCTEQTESSMASNDNNMLRENKSKTCTGELIKCVTAVLTQQSTCFVLLSSFALKHCTHTYTHASMCTRCSIIHWKLTVCQRVIHYQAFGKTGQQKNCSMNITVSKYVKCLSSSTWNKIWLVCYIVTYATPILSWVWGRAVVENRVLHAWVSVLAVDVAVPEWATESGAGIPRRKSAEICRARRINDSLLGQTDGCRKKGGELHDGRENDLCEERSERKGRVRENG